LEKTDVELGGSWKLTTVQWTKYHNNTFSKDFEVDIQARNGEKSYISADAEYKIR
jgi:hypothetical protein